MSISLLLDQRLSIQQHHTTPDDGGGSTTTFAPMMADVACAIEPLSAFIVTQYAQREIAVDYCIYTTADLSSASIGDRFSDGTAYYTVKAIRKYANRAISNETIWQVDCLRSLE